jgi:hypothetical protein
MYNYMITELFAPFNFPVDGAEMGPMAIFKDLTPAYMKKSFLKWCEIGLAEVGSLRELEYKVIKHVETEFIGLINAVYFVAAAMRDDLADDQLYQNLEHYIDDYYKKDVKERDTLLPPVFCQVFFEGITRESAKSILWLLMEVVIANKGKYDYQCEPKVVLNLYERYIAVVDLGHELRKAMEERNKSRNKKSGGKSGRKIKL